MKFNNIAKILSIGVMALLFTGCGGSGGSDGSVAAPIIDNTTRDGGQKNEYGYFGPTVLFGETKAAQSWTIETDSTPTEKANIMTVNIFTENGISAMSIVYATSADNDNVLIPGYGDVYTGEWGVNNIGTQIIMMLETDEKVSITMISTLAPDCYEVAYDIDSSRRTAVMCKYIEGQLPPVDAK